VKTDINFLYFQEYLKEFYAISVIVSHPTQRCQVKGRVKPKMLLFSGLYP